MKKFRRDAYERQLTPDELGRLHTLLLQPDLARPEVQAQIPEWRKGNFKGRKPSLVTLGRIAERLNAERMLEQVRFTERSMASLRASLGGNPDLGKLSGPLLDTICTLVGQQILERVSGRSSPAEDNDRLRILLKREDQRLARARFMRETCKHFLKWYKDERVRAIARSREANAEKIEKLGKLIYGNKW